MMFVPNNYIKRNSSTIPFGYELDADFDGYLKPIPEELEILNEVADSVFHGEISLGIAVDWLEAETGKKLSRPGLKKYVDKKYGRFGK
tara:strand:+ start:98 stop:361 length:264 start_codon:yes stop_codon:yes gene_type:complete